MTVKFKGFTHNQTLVAPCFHIRCSCWRIRWQQRLPPVWRLRPVSTSCCCKTGTCSSTWPCLFSSWKSWRPTPQNQHSQASYKPSFKPTGTVSDWWEPCSRTDSAHVRSGSPCSALWLPNWREDGAVTRREPPVVFRPETSAGVADGAESQLHVVEPNLQVNTTFESFNLGSHVCYLQEQPKPVYMHIHPGRITTAYNNVVQHNTSAPNNVTQFV